MVCLLFKDGVVFLYVDVRKCLLIFYDKKNTVNHLLFVQRVQDKELERVNTLKTSLQQFTK